MHANPTISRGFWFPYRQPSSLSENLLKCDNNMKRFKEYNPDQQFLLPPALNDWLEVGHLAYFIGDVGGSLDLSDIYAAYESDGGGQPAYDPPMMVSLLLYGYCVGIASSRKIEQGHLPTSRYPSG